MATVMHTQRVQPRRNNLRPRCLASKAAFSIVFFVLSVPARAQVTDLGPRFQPPPNAMQAAQIVGVEPIIAKLAAFSADRDLSAGPGMSLEELALRQQITEAVVAGSSDVDPRWKESATS